MPHKQNIISYYLDTTSLHPVTKLNKKLYKGNSRRPVLYSSDDVERMAIESSRARLMMQLVQPCESREKIDSYNQEFKNVHPILAKPADTKNEVTKTAYTTYSSLVQGLRWCYPIESYSGDSQTDTEEDSLLQCENCKMNEYINEQYTQGVAEKTFFKDNIVQFTDNSTMTRNLVDSSCGARTPLSKPSNASEESMSTDKTRDKSKPNRSTITPILKNAQCKSNCAQNTDKVKYRTNTKARESLDNQNCSDYEKLLKSYSQKSANTHFFNNDKNDYEHSRKVLYDEGININSVTDKAVPTIPNLSTPIAKMKPQKKISDIKLSQKPNKQGKQEIPHMHRINSRYHKDCREPIHGKRSKLNYSLISPVLNTSYLSKPLKNSATPFIRLPRKLLTSERNIEAFIEKRQTRKSVDK